MQQFRLLLVDNSPADREMITDLIVQNPNYRFLLEAVPTAEQGLARLEEGQYDCVILDYCLPGANGLWLIKQIHARLLPVAVVMLTAEGNEQLAVKAIHNGAHEYLPKQKLDALCMQRIVESALYRRQQQNQLYRLASLDQLTGLASRQLLMQKLDAAMQQAGERGGSIALLFLDLDRFKPINDEYGHLMGDEVLREVGRRLTGCVRSRDLVARLGGDEFVVLIDDLEHSDMATCTGIAQRVRESICGTPACIGSLSFSLGVSIGISLFPELAGSREELLHSADQAMYESKRSRSTAITIATPAPPMHDPKVVPIRSMA